MEDKELTQEESNILFADLFMREAEDFADTVNGYIERDTIDFFYAEVAEHRKNWDKRNEYLSQFINNK